jgi:hypothetical protein
MSPLSHSKFSAREKWYEAKREIEQRLKVYARIQSGKPLTKQQERQIALMQDIADDYKRLATKQDRERIPGDDCSSLWAQRFDRDVTGPQPDPNAIEEHLLHEDFEQAQMSMLEKAEEAFKRG